MSDKLEWMKVRHDEGCRARTPEELAELFMNPNTPKTEAEHWAVREIEKLRAEIERLRAELERARGGAWEEGYNARIRRYKRIQNPYR